MTECVKALKDALTLACKGTPLAAALETGVIECCTQYQTTRKARTRIPEQLAEICSIRFFRPVSLLMLSLSPPPTAPTCI